MTYKEGFEFVQARRSVINPNFGFISQLVHFYKRLYEGFNSIPVTPRVYALCSHEREDPFFIVAKFVSSKVLAFSKLLPFGLACSDARGIFPSTARKANGPARHVCRTDRERVHRIYWEQMPRKD